jgi:hypothetical protein
MAAQQRQVVRRRLAAVDPVLEMMTIEIALAMATATTS